MGTTTMKRIKMLAVFILAFIAGIYLYAGNRFASFDEIYWDYWHSFKTEGHRDSHVVLVSIDDKSLAQHKDEPLIFWGPRIAEAIGIAREAGAKTIGIDMVFETSVEKWFSKRGYPSSLGREYDTNFRREISRGDVILAGFLDYKGEESAKLILPDKDFLLFLAKGASDIGLINMAQDADGVVRSFVREYTADFKPFAIKLVEKFSGSDPLNKINFVKGASRIGYLGPQGSIPAISLSDLLEPGADKKYATLLKNKIVIVSADFAGNQDRYLTPYSFLTLNGRSSDMPGGEIQANIVETIMSGIRPVEIGQPVYLAYLLIVLALAIWIFARLPVIYSAISLCGLIIGAAIISLTGFFSGMLIPVASLQATLVIGFLGILGIRLTGEEMARRHLRKLFGRYVPNPVIEKLLASGFRPDVAESVEVTILFSDIRNFTTISETLGAKATFELLNTYYSRIFDHIDKYGGLIDKFMGDGIMVVFGSPVPDPNHARHAIQSALELIKEAENFSGWVESRFPDHKLPAFKIGVGINTGIAMVGNLGHKQRSDFATIGDVANAASRLESQTKELKWDIIASKATVERAGSGIKFGRDATIHVKGKNESIEIFEVLGCGD